MSLEGNEELFVRRVVEGLCELADSDNKSVENGRNYHRSNFKTPACRSASDRFTFGI